MSTNDPTFEIPPRNTRAFAEYKAGVEWEYKHGATIQYTRLDYPNDWTDGAPIWNWDDFNYRVAPAPPELHPIDQWRAMSPEEREGQVMEICFPDGMVAKCDGESYVIANVADIEKSKASKFTFRIRELTLAERNAAVQDKWEAMEETERKGIRRAANGDHWTWAAKGINTGGEWSDSDTHLELAPEFVDGQEYKLVHLPQPRYVPWTIDSCPVGAVIRAKNTARVRVMIIGAAAQSAAVSQAGSYTYEQLLEEWTMDDGTPCGTLEQPQP